MFRILELFKHSFLLGHNGEIVVEKFQNQEHFKRSFGRATRLRQAVPPDVQDSVARERTVENDQKSKFRVFADFRVKFGDAEIFIKAIDAPRKHVTPRRVARHRSFPLRKILWRARDPSKTVKNRNFACLQLFA